ncbi:hypothetical protein [Pseudogemmobacter bohemicus]|uniref:hypothetical protein n=1 Tax=Pseudogemmobacter bohemicus TaxID=2250708 RepID=UPI000DD3F87E|nr:hypothetical protein [Pseudogemmobacter bohemicus]
MDDDDRSGKDLRQGRRELAEAIEALGKKLDPSRFFPGVRGGEGPVAAAMPVLEAGLAAVRANPRATVLAGLGLAGAGLLLAYGGASRGARREAWPEWLVGAASLREEAARLRARVERARVSGALDEAAARDSLDDIDASLETAIRQQMGQGLDGLEEEARAAALAAREAAWQREFGKIRQSGGKKPARGTFGRILSVGTIVTAAGGLLAAFLARDRRSDDAFDAGAGEVDDAEDSAAARRAVSEDLEQLSLLVARLSRSLREAFDAAPTPKADQDHGGDAGPDRA